MRIINGTWWSTEDLRRIIAASMKARVHTTTIHQGAPHALPVL